MNKYDIIMKNIKDNLYKSDEELLNALLPLYEYLYKKIPKYKEYFVRLKKCKEILSPLLFNNLDNKERLLFFIRSSLIKIDDNRFQNFDQDMTNIFRNYIDKHTKDFLEIIKNNDDIEEMYLNWFKIKEYNTCFKNEFYNEIFNLPKFKEIVLEDEKFILDHLYLSLNFYLKLPDEYGYLIGLMKSTNIPIKTAFKIYNKYFNGILHKSDQLKLLKASIIMDKSDYSFGIENNNKRLEFTHCLKKIYKNKEYYNILKKISKKSKLDLSYIISFADKYDDTDFFINISSKKKLTENDISKIKCLAISEKIINNNIIKNLNNISLNDIINSEKEENRQIKINGGPNSKKSIENSLFSIDSSSKEIRRIDTDGKTDIKKLNYYGSHLLGLDLIYPEIDFEYNDTVFEKAIKAIIELDSITFVIEGEACLIIIPKNINNNQKAILIDWINNAKEEANIAINIYDKNTNKNETLIFNEIGKKDTIVYIQNLNKSDKKYTYNM